MVMKASRSEAARAAVRADENDAARATWQGRRRRGPASFQRGGELVIERAEQDSY